MKKIAVFFRDNNPMWYPFNKEEYWVSYQEFNEVIKSKWAELYIVRWQKTYLWNSEFSNSWQFKNWELVETGHLKVDILYNKGYFIPDNNIEIFNKIELDEICTNKWKTYDLFEEYCPKTILAGNEEEFLICLKQIKTEKIVIKPLDEEEWNWVFIWNSEYIRKCPKQYPILVQEFIDSSNWIPGIIEWIHDLRVAVINWKILYSFVRTPAPWELLANVARGWKLKFIDIKTLPKKVLDIVFSIDKKFEKFWKRFYWIDMAFTKNWIKIIELNSQLWLLKNDTNHAFKIMKEEIVKMLIN